jgi:hypothetical protein
LIWGKNGLKTGGCGIKLSPFKYFYLLDRDFTPHADFPSETLWSRSAWQPFAVESPSVQPFRNPYSTLWPLKGLAADRDSTTELPAKNAFPSSFWDESL